MKNSQLSSLQSYKECNTEREEEENQKKEDQENPEGVSSPISENVVHYIGASRYFNDFIPSQPNA